VRAHRAKAAFLLTGSGTAEQAAEKTRFGRRKPTSGVKARSILKTLAARLEAVPFPKLFMRQALTSSEGFDRQQTLAPVGAVGYQHRFTLHNSALARFQRWPNILVSFAVL
jgi:hypothetical protein